MPYILPRTTQAPVAPGIGIGTVAEGQERYKQLLAGVDTRDGIVTQFVNTCPFFNSFLVQTPFGEQNEYLFDANGVFANNVEQVRAAAYVPAHQGPAVAIVYVDASQSNSTAARLQAIRGTDNATLDFNPLNGVILATTGPGTKAIRSLEVDGTTWHEVTISFGNQAAPASITWRLFPQILPSPLGRIVFTAPGFMAMESAVANLADVPPLQWLPDSGVSLVPAGVSNESAQGRLPALSHNPSLIYKSTPLAYQIEGNDLGRTLIPLAEQNSVLALPNYGAGLPESALLPLGWFCYIDTTVVGAGSCQLFDPGAANIIEFAGFSPTTGTNGLVSSVFLDQYKNGTLFMLMFVGRDNLIGATPRWLVQPVVNTGRMDFAPGFSGTMTQPYGVRELYLTGAAGGGAGGSAFPLGGGGGGSGDAVSDFIFPLTTPGGSFPVTVGTGGAAPALNSGLAGNPGTFTQFGALVLGGGTGGSATGGPAGGPNAQSGKRAYDLEGGVPCGGDGGDNIAGGIGGVISDVVIPAASFPARGGGGHGENVANPLAAQNGADGFLIVRW